MKVSGGGASGGGRPPPRSKAAGGPTSDTEGNESISVVMTVETIKDHREMSTKLSFLFISLFFIHYAQ